MGCWDTKLVGCDDGIVEDSSDGDIVGAIDENNDGLDDVTVDEGCRDGCVDNCFVGTFDGSMDGMKDNEGALEPNVDGL